jgi:hypothetical protein
MEGLTGLKVIETRGGVTFKLAEFRTEPTLACMDAVPLAIPVAKPVFFTVPTDVFKDDHEAELVRFCVLPSL